MQRIVAERFPSLQLVYCGQDLDVLFVQYTSGEHLINFERCGASYGFRYFGTGGAQGQAVYSADLTSLLNTIEPILNQLQ